MSSFYESASVIFYIMNYNTYQMFSAYMILIMQHL